MVKGSLLLNEENSCICEVLKNFVYTANHSEKYHMMIARISRDTIKSKDEHGSVHDEPITTIHIRQPFLDEYVAVQLSYSLNEYDIYPIEVRYEASSLNLLTFALTTWGISICFIKKILDVEKSRRVA